MFGGHLIRAETHFARHARTMGWIDAAKQQGYWLHFLLFPLEVVIIVLLIRVFER
jgi:hypothetical protein